MIKNTQHTKFNINNIPCSMAIRPNVVVLYVGTNPKTGDMPIGEPCAVFYNKSRAQAFDVRQLNYKGFYPLFENNQEITDLILKELSPEEIFQYSLTYKYFPELVIAMRIVKDTVKKIDDDKISYINKWIIENENHKS